MRCFSGGDCDPGMQPRPSRAPSRYFLGDRSFPSLRPPSPDIPGTPGESVGGERELWSIDADASRSSGVRSSGPPPPGCPVPAPAPGPAGVCALPSVHWVPGPFLPFRPSALLLLLPGNAMHENQSRKETRRHTARLGKISYQGGSQDFTTSRLSSSTTKQTPSGPPRLPHHALAITHAPSRTRHHARAITRPLV